MYNNRLHFHSDRHKTKHHSSLVTKIQNTTLLQIITDFCQQDYLVLKILFFH